MIRKLSDDSNFKIDKKEKYYYIIRQHLGDKKGTWLFESEDDLEFHNSYYLFEFFEPSDDSIKLLIDEINNIYNISNHLGRFRIEVQQNVSNYNQNKINKLLDILYNYLEKNNIIYDN